MAKILIVDDDLETTALLESIIKTNKHEPFSITESKNATNAIEIFGPDLILLDIMMANINGIQLCKLIKSDPKTASIPVIMVSALGDEGSKRDSFNAGADDFVVKPIMPKSFMALINATLNKA
ncbi:MAG: response regulator [Anaerolineales bacterium]|nr:response regulator [Anaerolineales bacterium]